MLWILVTVLIGLVVIIVQLLLSYQKRAARIKIAYTPMHKMIDAIFEMALSQADVHDEMDPETIEANRADWVVEWNKAIAQ